MVESESMRRRVLLFSVATFITFMLLVWTAWQAWDSADQIADRLSAEKLSSLRLGDTFAADLHELRSDFRRYEAARDERHWEAFGKTRLRLEKALEQQSLTATSGAEAATLASLRVNLEEYASTSRRVHDRLSEGTSRRLLAADIAALGDQAADMAADIRSLIAHRQTTLERTMGMARGRLAWLAKLVLATLVITAAMATLVAVMVWRGMVRPMEQRLLDHEAVMRRSEKLASLGVLAAGVAHEIRNPLAAIKARLFIQERRLPPGSPAIEDAKIIDHEIRRLEHIVRTVLDFAKPSKPEPVLLSPLVAMDHVRQLLAPECERHGIKMHVEGTPDIRIRADVTQLHQVLLNLSRNALEAVGRNGHVRLRARRDHGRLGANAVPSALIEIEDDGPGLTAEARDRLFDPFFTTKASGTGLGLSISARIVEGNGGTLELGSSPGHGTTFCLSFPCEA